MGSCAHCGKASTVGCSHCVGAPEYDDGDAVTTFWCSPECRAAHEPTHQECCYNLQRRKTLLRTAKLLKAALLAYKEVVYDIHVTRISHDKDNGTLVLTHKPNRIERHPFPSHLTSIEEHKQAALLVNQCTMSISLLGPMARGLLAGIVSRMDVAVVEIQNPPLTIKFHPHDGIVADRKFHTIVEATLDSSQERWLIDVTGCQYGFRDILLPLEKYIAQNNCSSYELLQPYGHTETTDQDELSRSPLIILTRGPSEQQLADIEIEKGYRRHFAALVRAIVNQGLTQGPDAQFAVTLDELVRRVITYMSSYQPQTGAYQESPTY